MNAPTAALRALASLPPTPLTTLQTLPGEVNGIAFKDWTVVLDRRFGAGTAARVREAAGLDSRSLPDRPSKDQWFPVASQLALTRTALDLLLGGELLALERLLVDEALGTVDRVKQQLLRLTVRPGIVLKASDRIYRGLYRPGFATADVNGRHATVAWHGAAFQTEPLWQALQVTALVGMFRALGLAHVAIALGRPEGAHGAFALTLDW